MSSDPILDKLQDIKDQISRLPTVEFVGKAIGGIFLAAVIIVFILWRAAVLLHWIE